MKKSLLYAVLALALVGGGATADARSGRGRHDHHDHHDRHDEHDRYHRYSHSTRTIYVIENRRPVRRVVYVDPAGFYYRIIGGRRVRIRERYFTSYPSRYFYPDGRRRIGISFSF